jgi:hypothetical protein
MIKNYKEVKFYLFTNSYSGKKITIYLKGTLGGQKLARAIKRLSVVLEFGCKQITDFIIFNTKPVCPYKRLPNSLKIYLEIENELSKLSEEKLDEYSTALEDYQRQLLYPAIERAVGNLLESIDDDGEFQKLSEEKFKSAIYIYYKVARKYGLPTMRNIPFILSIIT